MKSLYLNWLKSNTETKKKFKNKNLIKEFADEDKTVNKVKTEKVKSLKSDKSEKDILLIKIIKS